LNFYFLEMNTRLQVEHPITELISGVDLVEMQIRIARGEALPFTQDDLQIKGHALELRVYAEDPLDNFMPSVGRLERYRPPTGEGIRVDDGFTEGMDIPIYYDPMLAKLVTYGENREAAIRKMITAIEAFEVEGVATTLPFGKFVCQHEAFRSGKFDTNFVKLHYQPEMLQAAMKNEAQIAAALAKALWLKARTQLETPAPHLAEWWEKR
ncbi:MAG: biotin carboxylase, partial [Bacteroidetes bacterium]